MERAGASCYVYAKACGMYARSFVGTRARRLFEARRLPDLWSLLFGGEVPLVPEGMLAQLIERKSEDKAIADFVGLLAMYDTPDPVSRALLSFYDFANLKAMSSALALGATERPRLVDVGSFSVIDASRWPDLAAVTRGSPVAWYDRVPERDEAVVWETRLDHEYYRSLWGALESLPRSERQTAEPFVGEEISLQNAVWTLRLRAYYGLSADEIVPLLAGAGNVPKAQDPLCRAAMDALETPLDSWPEWSAWRYAWLLNPHEEGVPWTVDPRWAQLAGDRRLSRLAMRSFHQNPFSVGTLVAFFRIKQLETQMIRVAAEGIRLGLTDSQIQDFMGESQNA